MSEGDSTNPFMRDGKPLKSKADRVKESVTILRKVKELGIATTDPGYLEVHKHLKEWIAGGDAWDGRIDFLRYGRRAELVLPVKPGRVASMTIFAPRN